MVGLTDANRTSIIDEIAQVPIPDTDPIFGVDGPLSTYWK
jgi:uncharacterized protein YjlB